MSFGFIRKQSPASIADMRRRRAGWRYKVLTNLKINEVSSVDSGAGRGVRVLLTKRDSSGDEVRKWNGRGELAGPGGRGFRYVKGDDDMPNTLSDRIQKSHAAAVQGHITWGEAAQEQMERALEQFPNAKTPGEALDLYMQTEVGKRDINNLHKLQFTKQQWETRLGDGVQAGAVLKAEPKIRLDDSKDGAVVDGRNRVVEPDDGTDDGTDDQGVEEPWDKRVQAVMDKLGCSKDEAISALHRAEKVSKGI
jgi:hypothetical protein